MSYADGWHGTDRQYENDQERFGKVAVGNGRQGPGEKNKRHMNKSKSSNSQTLSIDQVADKTYEFVSAMIKSNATEGVDVSFLTKQVFQIFYNRYGRQTGSERPRKDVDRFINSYEQMKSDAILAPASEYKDGYMKALTNVTATIDEYLPGIDFNGKELVLSSDKRQEAEVERMRLVFEAARERVTHPDWDYIHEDWGQFENSEEFRNIQNKK